MGASNHLEREHIEADTSLFPASDDICANNMPWRSRATRYQDIIIIAGYGAISFRFASTDARPGWEFGSVRERNVIKGNRNAVETPVPLSRRKIFSWRRMSCNSRRSFSWDGTRVTGGKWKGGGSDFTLNCSPLAMHCFASGIFPASFNGTMTHHCVSGLLENLFCFANGVFVSYQC